MKWYNRKKGKKGEEEKGREGERHQEERGEKGRKERGKKERDKELSMAKSWEFLNLGDKYMNVHWIMVCV